MTRRLVPMLLLGVIVVTGLVVGQEPPAKEDEAPLRLKRKKRPGEPPPAAKEEKPKPPEREKPADPKEKEPKEKAKDEEPIVPEDGGMPGDPEEDEKDVLERVSRNMRSSEEKLGNRETGEPLAQQQRDILRDLDGLIKKSEQQQGGGGAGGGADQDQQPQQGEKGATGEKGSSGSRRQQQARNNSRGGGSKSMARNQRQPKPGGSKNQPGGKEPGKTVAGGQRPGSGQGTQPKGTGTGQPGVGMDDSQKPREMAKGEDVKDVWGHLPESLRAEMNAYSNPQPFHPRYDRVIREYYKTIAAQGRKKGD